MKQELAVAMALAIAGIGVGLAPVPQVAATSACDDEFAIPDSEPADSNNRTLGPEDMEIGIEDVVKNNDETLHVELLTPNDELQWTVYFEDSQLNCVEYTDGGCDGPNSITQPGVEQTCTLKAPEDRDYWVLFENLEDRLLGDSLDYKTWSS